MVFLQYLWIKSLSLYCKRRMYVLLMKVLNCIKNVDTKLVQLALWVDRQNDCFTHLHGYTDIDV